MNNNIFTDKTTEELLRIIDINNDILGFDEVDISFFSLLLHHAKENGKKYELDKVRDIFIKILNRDHN